MGISHYERDMQIEGKSWKEKLRHKLAKAIMKSFSFEDFLRRCKKKGIEVVYEPTHKYKIKYRLEGQQRFVRGETLGEFYTADAIAEFINNTYKAAEERMLKADAEPVIAPKAEPIAEPKPTITAVPKTEPTAAPSERGGVVYNALLEEELHSFIETELPPEKLDEMETLLIDAENAVYHAAVEYGMKYGARLTAELLK